MHTRSLRAISAVAMVVLSVSACSTNQVADNTGDAIGFVGSTAIKTVAGAGRIAYQGGAAVVDAVVGDED